MALAGCVSTPQTASVSDEISLSQTQSDLRTASRDLTGHFQEAGWSTGEGGSIGALAGILLNGRTESREPDPVVTYLARIAPPEAGADTVFTAIETDLAAAASMAGTVAVHARAIGEGDSAETSALAGDISATEDAIVAVSRALEFFGDAIAAVDSRLDEEQRAALIARRQQLRAEYERLGESADAIADRRRAARSGILS